MKKKNKITKQNAHLKKIKESADSKKNEKMYVAMILLVFLLFCFGCTKMSRIEKNLCYSLTTQSYSYIPVCETEKSCFEKVDEMFDTELGYSQESRLYELKNHSARSWFYYNKAVTQMKKISSLCQAGDSSSLPGEINQARFFLDQAFIEMDSVMKESFNIVSAEKTLLEEQEIDLAKEESLYESLVELRQILSELETGKTNSESYVSFYLSKVEAYNNSGARLGLPYIIEKEKILIDEYELSQKSIFLPHNIVSEAWFPLVQKYSEKIAGFIENSFYSKESIVALEQFPAKEFMALYSNLGGKENSALKRFADLMNRVSSNGKKTEKELVELWKFVEEKNASSEKNLEQIASYSSKKFLLEELLSGKITTKENCEEEYLAYEKKLLDLREKKSKGALTIGTQLKELKGIIIGFETVLLKTELLKKEYSEKLANSCDLKAEELKNKKSSDERLQKMVNEIIFISTKTIESKGNEKLEYCGELVEKGKELEQAIKDYSVLEAQKKDSAKECFTYLEKVFAYAELFELKEMFEDLKKTEITKENLLVFEQRCENIKAQVDTELKTEKDFEKSREQYFESKTILFELEKINANLNDPALGEKIVLFKQKIRDYSKYFEEESRFDLTLAAKGILYSAIDSMDAELNSLSEEKIIEYAKKNAEFVFIGNELVFLGADLNAVLRAIIPNPFKKINADFSIKIPFLIEKTVKEDFCIAKIETGEKESTIYFDCLNYGNSVIDFISKTAIKKTEENRFVFVSNKESLIEKTITVNSIMEIKKLFVETEKPKNTAKIIALFNEKELAFSEDEKKIGFIIEEVKTKSKIRVFYYVNGLISTKLGFLKSENNSENETIDYELWAENGLGENVSASIQIDLPVVKNVEKIVVFDNSFAQKEIKVVDGKIILKNESFLAREQKKFTVRLVVNGLFDYYLSALENQAAEFASLNERVRAAEIRGILEEGTTNSLAKLKEEFHNNLVRLDELKKGSEKEKNLFLMKEKFLEKINELREKASELQSLGLIKEREKLEGIIEKAINSFDLTSEKGLAKAFDLVSKTIFDSGQTLVDASEDMWKKIEEACSGKNNAELIALKNLFLEKKTELEKEISFDPVAAKKLFAENKNNYDRLLFISSQLEKNAETQKKLLEKELVSLSADIEDLINWLNAELFADESKTVGAKLILPITRSRLEKLRLLAIDEKSSESALEEKKEKLLGILSELKQAVNSVKKQAALSFNNGIDNRTDSEVMQKAKSLIDSNRFVDAMFSLNLAEAKNPVFSSAAGFIVPIIVIIVIAFLIKNAFSKKGKEEDEKKKIILDSWNEKCGAV